MFLRFLTAAAIASAPTAAMADSAAAPLSVTSRAAPEVEGSDLGGNYLLAIGGVLVTALGIFLLVGDFDKDADPQPASPWQLAGGESPSQSASSLAERASAKTNLGSP